METQTVVRTEEHRASRDQAEEVMRQVLGEDGVKRVVVRDTHGHELLDVPVRPDEVGQVMEPVVAATKAVADTVGDIELRVEKEGELPAEGDSRAGMRERERARAQREATGEELTNGVLPEEVANAPANVTRQDVERIREANAVPTGDARRDREIEPEQLGDPDLKDAGAPYAPSEPGRGSRKPSR